MILTTPVSLFSEDPKIDHLSKVFLMGSCFVENIGEKLDYYKFQNLRNPFGILYHPLGLENFLSKAAEVYEYTAADVFHHNERWHCFAAHSELSNTDRDVLINDLNKQSQASIEFLKTASHIILTLGTSWVYRNNETEAPVANCHKLPQKKFTRELSPVEEIERSLHSLVYTIRKLNSNVKIIFTISPVRHLKDGVVGNTLSKAHLLSAVHNFLLVNGTKAVYFPAFEIMMDELRDYRFYSEDMLHPNSTAIQFIWEKFTQSWCSPITLGIMHEIEKIQKGLSHRPFNKESLAHQEFSKKLMDKVSSLTSRFPHIKFF